MSFKPVRKLEVWRTLMRGDKTLVGVLAQNRQGVFFQYSQEYLSHFGTVGNLSPYQLRPDTSIQAAPATPHFGLHGTFADSLPDGWGLLLQDRMFRQQNISPTAITAMDRLALVGDRAMGALSYQPATEQVQQNIYYTIGELGLAAQAVFDGQTETVLQALVAAGSSGGARPKAQLFFSAANAEQCTTEYKEGLEAWLVKFTSDYFTLGHDEGVCEAAYLQLAKQARLHPPEWQLLPAPKSSGASYWLALKRFDVQNLGEGMIGKKHLLSACALLDADYRAPTLDYQDLIKATGQLCRSPQAAQLQFRSAIFNLFASNLDEHSYKFDFVVYVCVDWHVFLYYALIFI